MDKQPKRPPPPLNEVSFDYATYLNAGSQNEVHTLTAEDFARAAKALQMTIDERLLGIQPTVYDCQGDTHFFAEGAARCKCGKLANG